MHRALLVSEVLLEIFAYFNQILGSLYTGKILSRKSLAALARTCKTFHEPAMDVLWADMRDHGIHPLLGCVTRLHPMIYPHNPVSMYLRFEGVEPLSKTETHQFLRHAARVRAIGIKFDNHFHLLSVLPINTCLFPKLFSLSFMVGSSNRSLYLLLSTTLRRCRLLSIRSDMNFIATRCAALEDLSIGPSGSGTTADELSLLTETVRSCKRLKHLCCAPLGWVAWSHLSNLPTLLTVRIIGYSDNPLGYQNLHFGRFLNVTVLHFRVELAAYILTVMEHSEFPSLKEFEIHVGTLPWAEAEKLFGALSQCKACQTLEHIAIFSNDTIVQESSANSLTAIRQFLCFAQLRTLRLGFGNCSIYLNNDILLEAVSSWPPIRCLELGSNPRLHHPPTVTFHGLFAALRLCPHLHTLHISMDTVNIDIDPTAESFQHALKTLDLTSSDAADVEAVAHIISSMLPFVNHVKPLRSGRLPPVWQDVNRCLESSRASAVLGRHITEVTL
ncbi:hypothetical protein DFH29DRAFT_1072659 [Suillus ampliporus]|nr:hypothetical protein DFH29DRAFT_1072659 [Suillus ampliporus]